VGELSAPVVVLRVTVRAPDLDAFITRYSRHIAGDRIFIFSKAPQPVGTRVRFNLQLQNGEVLIQGKGTVKRVQLEGSDARHPPGMEVQFTPLDERSSTLVDFMMATRAGLAQNVATAAPLVRAVVPPKPTTSSLPPALPPSPSPSVPLSLSPTPSPVPLPPPPRPPSPPPTPVAVKPPMPAVAPPRNATLPRVSALPKPKPKPKSAPVARPPSLSLESIWKSEAGQEATAVSPPPSDAVLPVEEPPPPAIDAAPPPTVAVPLPAGSASSAVAAPIAGADAAPAAAPAAVAESPPVDEPPKPANLPTIIPLLVDPSVTATPIFAESWGGDAPANPFSDVSDGAIEYFVEWSLEQSIGPRALPQAQFSDVPMALPGTTGSHPIYDPASRRRRLMQFGAIFAAGALVGAVVVALAKRSPAAAPTPVAAVAAPPPAAAAAVAAPPPAAHAAGGPADAELVVSSRPSGAAVTIDGEPAGNTPLSTHVSAGQHAVAFTKDRYAFATANVDAPGKLAFDLHRPSATLHVTSTPPAADVTIAGEHRGKTPVDVRLPGFESYDVRVAVGGAKPWRKTVYLSHATNRVDAALTVNKTQPPPRSGRR
jgi:hypothetical protein